MIRSNLKATNPLIVLNPERIPAWLRCYLWAARATFWTAWAALATALILVLLAWLIPLPSRLAIAPSVVVEFQDGSFAHVFLADDEKWRIPVSLGQIDPTYIQALLRLEDKRFYGHPGVDPQAIGRAAWQNLTQGKVVSGGSTITMQLSRMLEPHPRNLWSKLKEAFRALQLESCWRKEEILETYLQFLPFGGNVEGVQAASLSYFGHQAASLSAEEIATLLAVPQDPTHRAPGERNAARLKAARDAIAKRLLAAGMLDVGSKGPHLSPEAALSLITAAPVPNALSPFPRHAIHAAYWLRQLYPQARRLRTTLDRGTQQLTERKMTASEADLNSRGIHNGSLVVIDRKTASVRALVGNFDFFDAEHGGQITGFDTPRSVGSALKPFLYALAIDGGMVLPEFLVPDIPVQYKGYSPKNYDEKFSGLVRMEDALSQSLNIPFINLLQRLGIEKWIGVLGSMGAASLNPNPGHYGLSSIVGGIELTPLELASLYLTLANDGEYRPLHLLADGDTPVPSRMFSSGAAFLTRRALSRRDRPDFPERRRMSGLPPRIHWKTGTSYGHRDAWAAGSGPTFTVVVWLGNFDNRPSKELVGGETAGPLLFDVLEALADRTVPELFEKTPAQLRPVTVCAYSGYPPTPACPETSTALALLQHVPTLRCPYHLRLDIDKKTGLALNPACRAGRDFREETFLAWPASIRRYLSRDHTRLPSPPAFASGCAASSDRQPPSILHPSAGQVIVLLPGVPLERQEVVLEAECQHATGLLSWFVDGEFLGNAPSEERVWWKPKSGRHEIVVVDQNGLSDKRTLEVRQGAAVPPSSKDP